jgi:hypothetical protein
MFPEQIKIMAHVHQQVLLQEAEQRRILKRLRAQQTSTDASTGRVRYWLGAHLVDWGLKLQGCRTAAMPHFVEGKSYHA